MSALFDAKNLGFFEIFDAKNLGFFEINGVCPHGQGGWARADRGGG